MEEYFPQIFADLIQRRYTQINTDDIEFDKHEDVWCKGLKGRFYSYRRVSPPAEMLGQQAIEIILIGQPQPAEMLIEQTAIIQKSFSKY